MLFFETRLANNIASIVEGRLSLRRCMVIGSLCMYNSGSTSVRSSSRSMCTFEEGGMSFLMWRPGLS